MADHAAPSTTPISPKVLRGLIVGLLLTGLAAILGAITPEMLTGLGPWAGLVFTLVTALLSAVSAYLKRDPLRDIGQLATDGAVIKGEVVPEAAELAGPGATL